MEEYVDSEDEGKYIVFSIKYLNNKYNKNEFTKLASQTVIVGFADMFLPSVIASSIESDITRFVVAATSVTQLIYMSEIGSIIMGSKIPVSLKDLFIIFLERTIVTLPVIAVFAHLFF